MTRIISVFVAPHRELVAFVGNGFDCYNCAFRICSAASYCATVRICRHNRDCVFREYAVVNDVGTRRNLGIARAGISYDLYLIVETCIGSCRVVGVGIEGRRHFANHCHIALVCTAVYSISTKVETFVVRPDKIPSAANTLIYCEVHCLVVVAHWRFTTALVNCRDLVAVCTSRRVDGFVCPSRLR